MFGTLPILENNAKVAFKFEIFDTTIGNATQNILNKIFYMQASKAFNGSVVSHPYINILIAMIFVPCSVI